MESCVVSLGIAGCVVPGGTDITTSQPLTLQLCLPFSSNLIVIISRFPFILPEHCGFLLILTFLTLVLFPIPSLLHYSNTDTHKTTQLQTVFSLISILALSPNLTGDTGEMHKCLLPRPTLGLLVMWQCPPRLKLSILKEPC